MVINANNKFGSPGDLRRVHRGLILRYIHSATYQSRTQLADQTGLSAMAVTRIIRELLEAGLVEEVGKRDREGNPGRRQTELRIRPAGSFVIGLVISAFGHEVALMNANGVPLARRKLFFGTGTNADQAIEVVSTTINTLVEEEKVDKSRVLGIGIAIAAFVESLTGTVVQAPYLGWPKVDLGRRIFEKTGFPVIAENIANAINLAEFPKNTPQTINDVFMVHVSVTVGASYMHQGNLVHGANYSAGQIGHLPIKESSLICSCGSNDCLNTQASGWSVLANLGLIDSTVFEPEKIEAYAGQLERLITEASAQGTAESDHLFKAGWHLGHALLNVSLVVDPELVLLAGKMPQSPAYLSGCRAAWTDPSLHRLGKTPELVAGTVAPLSAAGFLALDHFLYSTRLDIHSLSATDNLTTSRG